jgi:protein TonB
VWAIRVVATLVALALLVAAGLAVKSLFDGKGGAPKKPPRVSLLPNTPPPPPPPPKEEKKPEPPKEQKEVKVEEQQKNEPPPDQTLKMEGAAGDGPSSFGSGKVANEDMSKVGAAGVVGGTGSGTRSALVDPFNVYATSIKGELQRMLARRADLRKRRYGIDVHLWVGEDGRVARYELVGSTSDDETDAAIRNALASLPAFAEAPPPKMPQPVRLRIVAGGRV